MGNKTKFWDKTSFRLVDRSMPPKVMRTYLSVETNILRPSKEQDDSVTLVTRFDRCILETTQTTYFNHSALKSLNR